jgi:hypothetical protein
VLEILDIYFLASSQYVHFPYIYIPCLPRILFKNSSVTTTY